MSLTLNPVTGQLDVVVKKADKLITDTTNFDTILSSAEDTVQKALDALDDGGVPIIGKVAEAGGITKGQAVCITGVTGDKPQVSLADNTIHNCAHNLGIAMETKTLNQNIRVMRLGVIEDVDTSAYTTGRLHLITSGDMQIAVSTSGAHIHMGWVTKVDATEGTMLVIAGEYLHDIRGVDDQQVEIACGDDDDTGFIYFQDYSRNNLGFMRGDGVFYWEGKVGFGTDEPLFDVDIVGSNIRIDSPGSANLILDKAAVNRGADVLFRIAGSEQWTMGCADNDFVGAGADFRIGRTSSDPDIFIQRTTGFMGVNTSNPDAMVEIEINSTTKEGLHIKGMPLQTGSLSIMTDHLDNRFFDSGHGLAGSEVVWNQQGLDIDYRIEGVGSPNAFFVQGSNSFVGVGTNMPDSIFMAEGSSFPVIRAQRTTTISTGVRSAMGVTLKKTNGTPATGFSTGFIVQGKNNFDLVNNLAAFYGVVESWSSIPNVGIAGFALGVFNNSSAPTLALVGISTGFIGINELDPQDRLEVNGRIIVKDKICFTQDDRDEFIDSFADGYMDYGATMGHRFRMATADTDVLIEFIGTTNSGQFTWMEDEDYFKFNDDVYLSDNEFIIFDKAAGNGIKVDAVAPTFGWRDLRAEIRTRGVGATDPNDTTYIGNVKAYSFSVNDEAWIEFHIPHDYVAGTDIHLHFHWSHNSAIVTGGSITLGADVTYAKGHDQAAFIATVNPTFSPNASTTQYQHLVSEVQLSASSPSASQIDTDDLEPDGLILARVYLSANNITSGGAVPDPFIHEVDLHYQSTNIATKQKAPDFYV